MGAPVSQVDKHFRYDLALFHSYDDPKGIEKIEEALAARGLRVWPEDARDTYLRSDGRSVIFADEIPAIVALVDLAYAPPWADSTQYALMVQFVKRCSPVILVFISGPIALANVPEFIRSLPRVALNGCFDEMGMARIEQLVRSRNGNTSASDNKGQRYVTGNSGSRKKVARTGTWQSRAKLLERWALVLGLPAILVGLLGAVLELPAKVKAFAADVRSAENEPAENSAVALEKQRMLNERREVCENPALSQAVAIINSACTDAGCNSASLKRLDTEVDKDALLETLFNNEIVRPIFIFFDSDKTRLEDAIDWEIKKGHLRSLRFAIDNPDAAIVFVIGKASSADSREYGLEISRERMFEVLMYIKNEDRVEARYYRVGYLGSSTLKLTLEDAGRYFTKLPVESYRNNEQILNQSVFVFIYPCGDLIMKAAGSGKPPLVSKK